MVYKVKFNRKYFTLSRIIKILGILILISGIFLELFFRIFYSEQLKTRNESAAFINDSILGFIPKPNSIEYLYTPSVDNRVQVNSLGFYGKDFNPKKSKGTYRIIVVGDSNETGNYTESNKSFIEICDDMFKKNQQKVEVINCAFGGTQRDVFKMKLIEYKIINYDPDLILLMVSIPFNQANEARENYRGYLIDYDRDNKGSMTDVKNVIDNLYTFKYRVITKIYDFSYIIRALCKKMVADQAENFLTDPFRRSLQAYVRKKAKALDQVGLVYTEEESLKMIVDLSEKLKKKGIELRLFFYYGVKYNNKIKFVIMKFQYEKYVLANDGHLNDAGHKVIANNLYKALNNGIIPSRFLNK